MNTSFNELGNNDEQSIIMDDCRFFLCFFRRFVSFLWSFLSLRMLNNIKTLLRSSRNVFVFLLVFMRMFNQSCIYLPYTLCVCVFSCQFRVFFAFHFWYLCHCCCCCFFLHSVGPQFDSIRFYSILIWLPSIVGRFFLCGIFVLVLQH